MRHGYPRRGPRGSVVSLVILAMVGWACATGDSDRTHRGAAGNSGNGTAGAGGNSGVAGDDGAAGQRRQRRDGRRRGRRQHRGQQRAAARDDRDRRGQRRLDGGHDRRRAAARAGRRRRDDGRARWGGRHGGTAARRAGAAGRAARRRRARRAARRRRGRHGAAGTTGARGGTTGTGGTPSTNLCTWPTAAGSQSVSSTINVSGTYDGGMKRFVGSGTLGGSGQTEGQGPLFQIANGGTLTNVIIGNPAADGVHCSGSCTLRNVWWEDVGEDAATLLGSSSSQTMTIDTGGAKARRGQGLPAQRPGHDDHQELLRPGLRQAVSLVRQLQHAVHAPRRVRQRDGHAEARAARGRQRELQRHREVHAHHRARQLGHHLRSLHRQQHRAPSRPRSAAAPTGRTASTAPATSPTCPEYFRR